MGLAVGQRVGTYEVTAPLGDGGMGRVWRARDVRLGRDVALKVLPDEFAADPERLARFERESLALAALNHPHIATAHGLEDTAAGPALVMEYIAGPTLAQRLTRGRLPLHEVLEIGCDLASALEAAHDRGIVHRDLKPSNLKLTEDGRLKVLDFGLAKTDSRPVSDPRSGDDEPLTTTTEPGRLLGTAAYMSPEQARGGAVDRRADMWAFGCILYELLCGARAFPGESMGDILAKVITVDPDWSALPADAPAPLRDLLERCLRKDPRHRLRDAGDARVMVEDLIEGRGPAADPAHAISPARRRRRAVVTALAVTGAIGVAAVGGWWLRGASTVPLRKLVIAIEQPTVDVFTRPRLAPDGHALVYGAAGRLWVRRLDVLEPRELPGSLGAEAPFWSHDSRTVAFARDRRLWRVPVEGGDPVPICDLPGRGRLISGAWREDEIILLAAWQGPLYQVSARGGDPVVLLPVDPAREVDFHELFVLPGGRGVLFVRHEKGRELQHIEVIAGDRRSIVLHARGGARYDNPRYAAPGYLVYERLDSNAGVWAAPFSLATLAATGEPVRIAAAATIPGVGSDGTLTYLEETGSYELTWVNRTGERLGTIGTPQLELAYPALSPNGAHVLASGADPADPQGRQLWLFDVASGARHRLHGKPTPTRDMFPSWGPDGRLIFYAQHRRDPEMLVVTSLDDPDTWKDVTPAIGGASFARHGRCGMYTRANERAVLELWCVEMDGANVNGPPHPYLRAGTSLRTPRLSPDGHFVAYTADEATATEVFLRRFPAGDERWRVSSDGGESPAWNAEGTELYYRAAHGAIMAVPVRLGSKVAIGAPRELFDDQTTGGRSIRGWDVTPDGQRFLVVRLADASKRVHVVVVQNWLAGQGR